MYDDVSKYLNKYTKGALKLPIQVAIVVPSTTCLSHEVSDEVFNKRVKEVRRALSLFYGGMTSVRAVGGYVSKKNRLITERAVMVTSYADKDVFKKKLPDFFKFIREKAYQWKQEAIGIIIENDMFYIESKRKIKC